MTPNREELITKLKQLLSLLEEEENYHPGLMSWQMFYHERVNELLSFFGVKPIAYRM